MNKTDYKKLTAALLKTARCEFFIDSFCKAMKIIVSVFIWMCFALKAMKVLK